MKPLLLLLCLLMLPVLPIQAANKLQLFGQFGNKAVILINGKRRVLSVNTTSPEGVKLITVEQDAVVVIDNGKRLRVDFTTHMSSNFTEKETTEVKIWADNRGSYHTPGAINGQIVNFLVDTGATSIAMNEYVARRLGIDYRYRGTSIRAQTASGITTAFQIQLDSVKVGEITLYNVEAAVLQGGYPAEVLLGMSFLKNVELERSKDFMILKYSQPAKAKP